MSRKLNPSGRLDSILEMGSPRTPLADHGGWGLEADGDAAGDPLAELFELKHGGVGRAAPTDLHVEMESQICRDASQDAEILRNAQLQPLEFE